jgi:hypothetical protein
MLALHDPNCIGVRMNPHVLIGILILAFSGFAKAHPSTDQPEKPVLDHVKPSHGVPKNGHTRPKKVPKKRVEILQSPLPIDSDTGNYGVSIVPYPQNTQVVLSTP